VVIHEMEWVNLSLTHYRARLQRLPQPRGLDARRSDGVDQAATKQSSQRGRNNTENSVDQIRGMYGS